MPPEEKESFMKSKAEISEQDDLRPEYDFASMQGGVRGKYAQRVAEGTNIVLLEPEIAQAFPTSQSVNEALRMLLKLARSTVKQAG
jgi:hypothetical protein